MSTHLNKNSLRKQLQAQRAGLTEQQQQVYSQDICQQIMASPVFQAAQHIAFYTPVKGEANPLPLMPSANKSFYLPVLSQQEAFHLFFVAIGKDTQYTPNIYGIPEPLYTKSDIISRDQLDLVIMPLVAADRTGSRLGMGGGYYDRSFAFKKTLSPSDDNKPLLMGCAYEFQLVKKLDAAAWDIPLDYLATNNELITIA